MASCYIGRRSDAITSYDGLWIHLVGTYNGDGTSGGVKLYINGSQVDTANKESNAGSYVAMENLGGDAHIGEINSDYTNGKIDDVRIFKRELSSDEAKELYDKGRSS